MQKKIWNGGDMMEEQVLPSEILGMLRAWEIFFQALGGKQRVWREWLCWEFLLAGLGSSLLAG